MTSPPWLGPDPSRPVISDVTATLSHSCPCPLTLSALGPLPTREARACGLVQEPHPGLVTQPLPTAGGAGCGETSSLRELPAVLPPAHGPPPTPTPLPTDLSLPASKAHGSSDKQSIFRAKILLSPFPGWQRSGRIPDPRPLWAAEPQAPASPKHLPSLPVSPAVPGLSPQPGRTAETAAGQEVPWAQPEVARTAWTLQEAWPRGASREIPVMAYPLFPSVVPPLEVQD